MVMYLIFLFPDVLYRGKVKLYIIVYIMAKGKVILNPIK